MKKFEGLLEHVVNILMMAAEMVHVMMAKFGFRSVDELIGHAKVSCEESARRDGSLLFSPKLLPAHASHVPMVSLVECEVVIGGTPDETFDVHVK